MKKLENGFVIPLIIAVVAILAIGGTVYFTDHKKVEAPIVIDTNLPPQIGTTTETRPRIDIINPTSASVGAVVQIKGVNFSGFEGDKNAWIVSKVTGVKGIIYGSVPSSDNLITFPLSQTYCTIDTSYSGQACPAVLDVTSGDYEIYIINPKGTSNKIPFTVTKSNPIACTMDATMCPDGSYVGRSGPDCKFVCPASNEDVPPPLGNSTLQIQCNSSGECNTSGVNSTRSNFYLAVDGVKIKILVDIETRLRYITGGDSDNPGTLENVKKWVEFYPIIATPKSSEYHGLPFSATIYGDWTDSTTFKANWIKWSIG